MLDITDTGFIPQSATACALGLFDGVHKGHQLVINTMCRYKQRGLAPSVFSFKTNSVTTKGHDGMVEMILTDSQKKKHFEKLGVEYIFSPEFNEYRNLSCESFVRDVLAKKMNCRAAACGKDFRFGKGALGDSSRLCELGKKYGIEVIVLDRLCDEQGIISSTAIRSYIRNGEIEKANEMLGYEFYFNLPVEHGKELARTLDHPTINQVIPKGQVLPRFGVYCTRVLVRGKWYKGVTNVGIKPTVHIKTTPLAETYIIGFEGNLYGEYVQVVFDHFVRPETKFANVDELKRHISEDTDTAIRYYGDKAVTGESYGL